MPVYVVCILERATFAVKKNGDTVKRVVVTGATGAIGRSLIKVCIKAGYEVLAIVHRGSQRALELECMEHCHVLRWRGYILVCHRPEVYRQQIHEGQ